MVEQAEGRMAQLAGAVGQEEEQVEGGAAQPIRTAGWEAEQGVGGRGIGDAGARRWRRGWGAREWGCRSCPQPVVALSICSIGYRH